MGGRASIRRRALFALATSAGFGASRIAARRKAPPRRFPVRR